MYPAVMMHSGDTHQVKMLRARRETAPPSRCTTTLGAALQDCKCLPLLPGDSEMPPLLFDCHCQTVIVTPRGEPNPVGVLGQKEGLEQFKTLRDIGHWQGQKQDQKERQLKTAVSKHNQERLLLGFHTL